MLMPSYSPPRPRQLLLPALASASRQAGASLLFALITLLALTLAAIALVRSVDTGALVLGNLGFRQAATSAADQATRQAIAWLAANPGSLSGDVPASGYYSTALDGVDMTGGQLPTSSRGLVNWDIDSCAYAAAGTFTSCTVTPSTLINIDASTSARYVITRLCLTTGDPAATGNTCAKPMSSSTTTAAARGRVDYSNPYRFTGQSGPYYRVVVRVMGTRSTSSFTETIVHF